jgi:hypothetical protein
MQPNAGAAPSAKEFDVPDAPFAENHFVPSCFALPSDPGNNVKKDLPARVKHFETPGMGVY